MTPEIASAGLAIAGALFVLFVVAKLMGALGPFGGGGGSHEARARLAEARRRARDRASPPAARAAALREAAAIAIEDLGRPSLAASYAYRAERIEPGDAGAVAFLAAALRGASRYRALERFLWQRLAAAGADATAGRAIALGELIALYEGPLRRPEIAAGLRMITSAGSGPR